MAAHKGHIAEGGRTRAHWIKTAGDARAPGKSWEFFTTFCGKTYVIGKFFVSGPENVKVSNNCADL
ncbi:hypothetical protein VSR34_31195 [Paraburkholderia sp. JHI2823]|uniref:hypothetical protein n=1 Tax=Paraburkholderia TaxID=1822464 RepID=UPI00040CCF8F|nr:hypothetical protein [Paraburkholderia mimosarum]